MCVRPSQTGLTAQGFLATAAIFALGSLGLSLPSVQNTPLSSAHYLLYGITLISLLHLSYLNHHTSRRSSTLILLFWPLYFLCSVIRVRTMILTGDLSPDVAQTNAGRLILAREALWLASIGVGMVDFLLELYSPEKRWKPWRMPWAKEGKIALSDDEEEEESRDAVDYLNGGGAVGGLELLKTEDGDLESPVLTANFYERWDRIKHWMSKTDAQTDLFLVDA